MSQTMPAPPGPLQSPVPLVTTAPNGTGWYNAAKGCYEPLVFFGWDPSDLMSDFWKKWAAWLIPFTLVHKRPVREASEHFPGRIRRYWYFEVKIVARPDCYPVIVDIQNVTVIFEDDHGNKLGSSTPTVEAAPVNSDKDRGVRGLPVSVDEAPKGTKVVRVTYTVHIIDNCGMNRWETFSWVEGLEAH